MASSRQYFFYQIQTRFINEKCSATGVKSVFMGDHMISYKSTCGNICLKWMCASFQWILHFLPSTNPCQVSKMCLYINWLFPPHACIVKLSRMKYFIQLYIQSSIRLWKKCGNIIRSVFFNFGNIVPGEWQKINHWNIHFGWNSCKYDLTKNWISSFQLTVLFHLNKCHIRVLIIVTMGLGWPSGTRIVRCFSIFFQN